MTAKVPKFISDRYINGAHGFRSEKRKQLRALKKILSDFRLGCAHLPCGTNPVDEITKQIEILQQSVSVKEWGR